MRRISTLLKEGLTIGGVTLLLVAAFPLIMLLFFSMRFVVVIGGAVALLAAVLAYAISPSARSWFETQAEQQFNYNGLHLATNVAIHPRHSWARIDEGHVVVGADDFVQATLGPLEAVTLPAVGSRIHQGQRAFRLRAGDRHVDVCAPFSGTVVSCNEELLRHPQLVNEDPFASGWAVRMRGDKVREERRGLLRGKHARSWFRGEVDRLIATALGETALAPALPDGGALVKDLHLHIDDKAWSRLKETSFEPDGPKPGPRLL